MLHSLLLRFPTKLEIVNNLLEHASLSQFTGLLLRAGGLGISLATMSVSPGYFETKPETKPLESENKSLCPPATFFTFPAYLKN